MEGDLYKLLKKMIEHTGIRYYYLCGVNGDRDIEMDPSF